jgi:polyribonucleotide nucleotidyltransferase
MLKKQTTSVMVGKTTLHFETGQMARQANGSVVLRVGETVLFSSACMKDTNEVGQDFFPLRVDYQEKFSSAGKTLGGFIKREGKPTERETLVCRLIDRPIRPMFPEGYFNEVQVLTYVLSYDGVNSPEPHAICCASAALALSDIPLIKPIGAVRIGYVNNQFVINPSPEEMESSKLDLILAGTEDAILMIEGHCNFLTEEQVLEAIETGHASIKLICHALTEWKKQLGKEKKLGKLQITPPELKSSIVKDIGAELEKVLYIKEKMLREESVGQLQSSMMEKYAGEGSEHHPNLVKRTFQTVSADIMRKNILDKNKRADGRHTKEIRQIHVEQHPLPRVHGSSLFTRGETQALAVCTLGGPTMGQRYENLQGEGTQRFYLQYMFPPFSVGEVGRMGPPGRREVGHGKLAERALLPSIPKIENFPYTIRLESNIMESNGSSSMASVCGGCLALMDAGVPIERPVAGIAMGLILENERFAILSDILGLEDYLGDMDFKVTGDEKGITAFQMDIKVEGITLEIMKAALEQAKEGRIHILKKMLETCPKANTEMSEYAPRITSLQIKPSKIGLVIGPSGKQIRAIIEETGVEIDIDDNGLVNITSTCKDSIDRAVSIVKALVADVEVGQVYHGKVTTVAAFGVFVELIPGKEGLCHISEFAHQRIEKMEDFAKVGDEVSVKVIEINDRGQYKLSRKVLINK